MVVESEGLRLGVLKSAAIAAPYMAEEIATIVPLDVADRVYVAAYILERIQRAEAIYIIRGLRNGAAVATR